MFSRKGHIERDSRGRERIVITPRRGRSTSHGRSTRELLIEAEEREQTLVNQVASLQTRLSFAERNEWNIRQQHQALVNEHHQCRGLHAQLELERREVTRLDDLLTDEEEKTEKLKAKVDKLEEKIRLLKRGVVEDYRARYETAIRDVDLLAQRLGEKNDQLRVADTRIADKNRTILYLKNYLTQLGYRVQV